MRGLPLVITAPSGAGKSTLIRKLIAEFPNFQFSVSYTTRRPRQDEIDGVDYNFISEEEFKAKIEEGFFTEWAQVHDYYYGTPLSEVLSVLEQGKDMLFDIDIQGAKQLKLTLPEAYFIFIFPPSMQELAKRLVDRSTDSDEAIQTRLLNAKDEVEQSHWFHAWIVNDKLDEAYDDLRACFLVAKLAPQRQSHLISNFLHKGLA